jgi:hypothetical protein
MRASISALIMTAAMATGQIMLSKHGPFKLIGLEDWTPARIQEKSDTPRKAGGLMSWAASKAVGPCV